MECEDYKASESPEITEEDIRRYESWLSQHPAPDKKRFCVGRGYYSARELVNSIKKGGDEAQLIHSIIMRGGGTGRLIERSTETKD